MSGLVTATNGGTSLASMTATQEELNLAVGLTAEGKQPESKEAEPKTESEEPKEQAAPEAPKEPEPASEPEPEQEEQEQQEAPVKGKGGFQRRIDKLTAKLRLTEQERDELRELNKQKAAEEPKPAQPKSGKPKLEDYQSPDEWADARDAWRESEARQADENERLRTVFTNFNKQVDMERDTHDDFDEVVGSSVEIPKSVELAIPHLKNGAAVAYHLGKNPDLAAQLLEMDPLEAVAEVGAISRELLAKRTAAPADKKPERRASAPIQPVPAGSSKASLRLDDPNLSQADYNKIRDEQERERRKL